MVRHFDWNSVLIPHHVTWYLVSLILKYLAEALYAARGQHSDESILFSIAASMITTLPKKCKMQEHRVSRIPQKRIWTKIYSFLMGVRPYFYDDCDQSFYNRAEEIEEEVRNSAHREVRAPSTPAASYRQIRSSFWQKLYGHMYKCDGGTFAGAAPHCAQFWAYP